MVYLAKYPKKIDNISSPILVLHRNIRLFI